MEDYTYLKLMKSNAEKRNRPDIWGTMKEIACTVALFCIVFVFCALCVIGSGYSWE